MKTTIGGRAAEEFYAYQTNTTCLKFHPAKLFSCFKCINGSAPGDSQGAKNIRRQLVLAPGQ